MDPPLDGLHYQLKSDALELCHVEGNDYIYDRKHDKILIGMEDGHEIPVKGWDYKEKKYGVIYTELTPHELAAELHAIPSEREMFADIYKNSPLMEKLFSEKELRALLHHDSNALTEEQILERTNTALKTNNYRLLSETAGGVLSLPEALSREALASRLGINSLTPAHAEEFARRSQTRDGEYAQNKQRLNAIATGAEGKLGVIWHKTKQEPKGTCVAQHEFQVTDGGIIGTTNLLECVAFIVHDPKTKRADLAHIDKVTDLKSINTMFDVVDAGNPLDVYLVGSRSASRHTAGRMIEQVQAHAAESGLSVTVRGVDFSGQTYMRFNAANAEFTAARPLAAPDHSARFARAVDDPRHISPLMPHNINGLSIGHFAGDTDAFHKHLHEHGRAMATAGHTLTRVEPGATSTTLATAPLHRLRRIYRDTSPSEPGMGA